MVKIEIEYKGQLQTEAVHTPSGTRILTDAPVDNGGKGSSFSPTDLVATALGTCMVTIMGLFAERHEMDLTGTKVECFKRDASGAGPADQEINRRYYGSTPCYSPKKKRIRESGSSLPSLRKFTSRHRDPGSFSLER